MKWVRKEVPKLGIKNYSMMKSIKITILGIKAMIDLK